MKLLHIDSSILGGFSVSRQLSSGIVAKLRETVPGLEIVYRDLAAEPLPHLSGFEFGARQPGSPAPSPAAQADLAASAEILEEFLNADIVVLGAPMYNLGVSSQLKAWIDRVVIAGKTFRYSESGPEGLAGSKRLIIASSRGGVFSEGAPAAAFDHQESYLRAVFGLIGIRDIEIVRAEGLSVGPELKIQALKAAEDEIANLKAA